MRSSLQTSTAFSLLTLAILWALPACESRPYSETLAPAGIADGDVYGRRVFVASCAGCHEAPIVSSRDDANWTVIVGDPRHLWVLENDDRRALLAYLTNNN